MFIIGFGNTIRTFLISGTWVRECFSIKICPHASTPVTPRVSRQPGSIAWLLQELSFLGLLSCLCVCATVHVCMHMHMCEEGRYKCTQTACAHTVLCAHEKRVHARGKVQRPGLSLW